MNINNLGKAPKVSRAALTTVILTTACALSLIALLPLVTSPTPGWDPDQLDEALAAAVGFTVAGWGVLQAVTSRGQLAELTRQNSLLEKEIADSHQATEFAIERAAAERREAKEARRLLIEQRLDDQMPFVSARLREFSLEPLSRYQGPEDSDVVFKPIESLLEPGSLFGQALVEVTNHGSMPVMLELLRCTVGGYDTEPTHPLGANGDKGMWAEPNSRADVVTFRWEWDVTYRQMTQMLNDNTGWDNGNWDLEWVIRATNLPGTVCDTLTIRASDYKPFFESVDSSGTRWNWREGIPAPFYGAYGVTTRRYLKSGTD